jgi:hypothetical protein
LDFPIKLSPPFPLKEELIGELVDELYNCIAKVRQTDVENKKSESVIIIYFFILILLIIK